MASGRILKSQISLSEQVNDLSLHSALLFTWMIPHADDFGRMHGSARKVKAQVVPMRDDFNAKKVEDCLIEISKANLILRYVVGGETYIQFPAWEEHQSGLHKRTKSKLPDPPEKKFPEIPGDSLLIEQEQEQKGTEQEQEFIAPSKDLLEAQKETIAIIFLPLNDGTEHPVSEADFEEMASLYPAADVMNELRAMRGWCLANKKRRKTKDGIARFIHNWLSDKQNKGGNKPIPQPVQYQRGNAAAQQDALAIIKAKNGDRSAIEGSYELM